MAFHARLTITLQHEANHNNDIRTYIGSELRFDEHTNRDEVDEVRDDIFQRSAGIFLWVSLVVRQLNDVFDNDGRMDAVRKRLNEIPRAAKETPVTHGGLALYGLFKDVVTKDTRNIPELVRLTQLIFCARRPLRPQEVFVALHRSYHEPFDADKVGPVVLSKRILAISKGLAEVTTAKEPTVQFIHETVREFLSDGGLSVIHMTPAQSINGHGNEELKISCLEQIRALDSAERHFDLLKNYRTWTEYRKYHDKGITTGQRKEFQRQVNQKFPFLEYATHYVLSHANDAAAQGMLQKPFLDSFPCHLWVPLHNLFEKSNAKRFGGPDTPILYIIAGHGFNELIRISTDQQKYATKHKNEQCQTALHNAIYSGHLSLDTARVLVGLDPKDRPPSLDKPKLALSDCCKSLLRAILDSDDVDILRKVIRDLGVEYLKLDAAWIQRNGGRDLLLEECNSLEMIDCLAEHSLFPNLGSAEENARTDADGNGSISPTSSLTFIRRAIEKHAELLTGTLWTGKSMFEYAVKKRFFPLAALYIELITSRSLATLNDCLGRATATGWLAAVKEAHCRGADLDFQDESGRTVLHKLCRQVFFGWKRDQEQRDLCSVLQYLLFECPKLGEIVDKLGCTALDLGLQYIWREVPEPADPGVKNALEILVKAGATTKTGFMCNDHQYPWVAIPWISVDFASQLTGETQTTNLDARDSLGRTPLSWCFWRPPGSEDPDVYYIRNRARDKGTYLLGLPDVDVNSCDNSGRTILEHLIRHPYPHGFLEGLTVALLESSALDVNLKTSDGQSPLALITCLCSTWPLEWGDIDREWYLAEESSALSILSGQEKISAVSEGLLKTAKLLLETQRVSLSEQKRCLVEAPNDLRSLICESIKKVEPDYPCRLETGTSKDPYLNTNLRRSGRFWTDQSRFGAWKSGGEQEY